jgi:hypothetical protein
LIDLLDKIIEKYNLKPGKKEKVKISVGSTADFRDKIKTMSYPITVYDNMEVSEETHIAAENEKFKAALTGGAIFTIVGKPGKVHSLFSSKIKRNAQYEIHISKVYMVRDWLKRFPLD